MTCKDCINTSFCRNNADDYTDSYTGEALENQVEKLCEGFKDKSRYIELPCNVGDTVYSIMRKEIVPLTVVNFVYNLFGLSIRVKDEYDSSFLLIEKEGFLPWYLTKEQAEQKLREVTR